MTSAWLALGSFAKSLIAEQEGGERVERGREGAGGTDLQVAEHIVRRTLHTARYTLHDEHCTLHDAHFTLHTSHCMMHIASAHCTVHASHYKVHTTGCTLHKMCSTHALHKLLTAHSRVTLYHIHT